MLGDWVLYHGEPKKIMEIARIGQRGGWPYENNDLDPIPLTEEVLEKNGFEIVSARDDNAGTMEKYFYPRIGYVYRFSNGEWEVDLIGYGRGFSGAAKYRGVIKYVHELQHVFRILKLEKEIEL